VSFDYQSKRWKRTAEAAKRRASWKCQCCDRSPTQLERKGYYLVVHHRFDAELYPEYRFDLRFLAVVCTECHDAIHGRSPPAPVELETAAVQLDWVDCLGAATLRDIDDMGLFERKDRRNAALIRAAEIAIYADEYDRLRAQAERVENVAKTERELEQGVLEEYERLRSVGIGEEDDASTTTKTTSPSRRGSA
jgi:predicted HNH restriction endonuclease